MRLKSRVKGIPHGLRFSQPEVAWSSINVVGKAPSWEALVTAVIAMRHANPAQLEKHKWPTDVESVANEVDAYNAKICTDNGWNTYVMAMGAGYSTRPLPVQTIGPEKANALSAVADKARKIWAGVKTLNNWLDSGEPPVPTEQSMNRAKTCIDCPLNGKGDFTRFFTVPAAASIRRQIERMHERSISGSLDGQLGVCEGCLCPLVIKTKTPMKFIAPQMTGDMIDSLRKGKDCWVIREMG